uniref:type IVB secretion system protein IcmH/DotU n=1 Tax=Glaesserella sp. TaxID=2094731 RepID=UPI00359F543B
MKQNELTRFYNPSTSTDVTVESINITTSVPIIKEKEDLLYEQVTQTDLDIDYDFKLETQTYNSLIELANPLLGMALRAKKITQFDEISTLYNRMQNEIIAISEKVKILEYNSAFQLSFRYCLCTFIDEAIMGTPWGKNSMWGERSLLAYFHNETWGGEKFYSILSRTMLEPEKYYELLEFIYVCLALGFQGKYADKPHGKENIQNTLVKLQKTLRPIRGTDYFRDNKFHIYEEDYSVEKPLPIKYLFWGAGAFFVVIYIIYSILLDSSSSEIIENINTILQ